MKLSLEKRSEGTISHRRVQLPWQSSKPFRILCIDGGGIKGILPAKILSLVESELLSGEKIADHVDMICGTSTGGILGIGLGLGIPSQQIVELYTKRGSSIFPKTRNLGALKLKHDRGALDAELRDAFGDQLFGACSPRMVIPSFDHQLEPTIYKTDHHPDYRKDWSIPAWEVAAATSAAPIFLGAHLSEDRIQWDGGLYANHPVMNGLVDALACYDVDRDNVKVVSIGCGKEPHVLSTNPRKYANAGFFEWALHLISTASALQLHDSLGQAGLLIGRDNILRIDPEVDIAIALDDAVRALEVLPSIAETEFKSHRSRLLQFFSDRSVPRDRNYSN